MLENKEFIIQIKGLQIGKHYYDFPICGSFFRSFENSQILDADLQAVLTSDAPKARPKKSVLRDGAKIFRDWHGTRYEVTVRGNKYEYNGTLYRSLSGVAKAITGVLWNGKTFFGITTE
jgi:hypothetical protein